MTRDPSLARRRRSIARLLGAALVAALAVPAARASICKYVDADGNVVYSNVAPGKGLRKLSCEIADEGSGRASGGNGKASATPSSFPRVEPETQKSRDEMRRKVLTDELSSEEKLLAEARDAYGNGAPPPLSVEKNDAEKYRQRIARLRQNVQVHERNIEALHKEIATTR
ncbi:MAG TPA: DUF4124 domain-containing protein [Casimicrobiaceae bacterium]|nr:DUF4124 domain-containing protein [Casimicrobiaceae bacterium]